jgi:hypothetical protein
MKIRPCLHTFLWFPCLTVVVSSLIFHCVASLASVKIDTSLH